MAKIQIQSDVSKESHELAEAVKTLILESKKALADGFQPGADIPAVVMASYGKMIAGLQGVDQLGAESGEDLAAFIKAWSLMGADLAGEFFKKPVAPIAPPSA